MIIDVHFVQGKLKSLIGFL